MPSHPDLATPARLLDTARRAEQNARERLPAGNALVVSLSVVVIMWSVLTAMALSLATPAPSFPGYVLVSATVAVSALATGALQRHDVGPAQILHRARDLPAIAAIAGFVMSIALVVWIIIRAFSGAPPEGWYAAAGLPLLLLAGGAVIAQYRSDRRVGAAGWIAPETSRLPRGPALTSAIMALVIPAAMVLVITRLDYVAATVLIITAAIAAFPMSASWGLYRTGAAWGRTQWSCFTAEMVVTMIAIGGYVVNPTADGVWLITLAAAALVGLIGVALPPAASPAHRTRGTSE